jgi:uncharacterized protein (DUF1499 family)
MNDSIAKGTKPSVWSMRLAVSGIALIVLALIGARAGLMPMLAMLLISIGSLGLIVGGLCGAIGLIVSNGTAGNHPAALAWLAVALGIGTVINAGMMMSGGGAPIHDISTDTDNPPAFVAIAELRGPNDNPVEYSGPDTAQQQRAAYPDIETIVLLDPRTFVFTTALQTAKDMGWEIVAENAAEGRIEATATTPFVGFKDDVVIRITAKGAETYVDVRSKSRIGKGDMGANAKRIREYSAKLIEAANP